MSQQTQIFTTESELKTLSAMLHDARFTADAIHFDTARQDFNLRCWVFERQPDNLKRSWRAYNLHFSNVLSCDVTKDENVEYYELATLRLSPDAKTLHLVTHYAISISLKLGRLEVRLAETNDTREHWD